MGRLWTALWKFIIAIILYSALSLIFIFIFFLKGGTKEIFELYFEVEQILHNFPYEEVLNLPHMLSEIPSNYCWTS